MGTIDTSPLNVKLDAKNPRFIIPPNPSQESLRLYLLENEDILGLADRIINYGGLMPGERIVVTEEDGFFVALEGNRRICTLQLLLNPELIPEGYKAKIPSINQAVRANIESLQVDFVPFRDTTLSVLATRHTDGPKEWAPVSKHKFFANLFEAGKTIDEISEITLEKKKDKIRTQLQEYYLLQYALELPVWEEEQQAVFLNIGRIKPTTFIRLFNTDRVSLGLSFDPVTYRPVSTLPKDKFDKAVELIATAAFVTKTVTTRSELHDVPGLSEIIKIGEKKSQTPSLSTPNTPTLGHNTSGQNNKTRQNTAGQTGPIPPQEQTPADPIKPEPKPIAQLPSFFENINCTIPNTDLDGSGILAIIKEVRDVSNPAYLARFPVAASMLLRGLLEQALKYHLKKINEYNKLKAKHNGDPSLNQIITHITNNLGTVFPDKTIQRTFSSVFSNVGLKDSLDLVVHHTNLVRIDSKLLESISKAGLRGLIEHVVTNNYA